MLKKTTTIDRSGVLILAASLVTAILPVDAARTARIPRTAAAVLDRRRSLSRHGAPRDFPARHRQPAGPAVHELRNPLLPRRPAASAGCGVAGADPRDGAALQRLRPQP